MKKVKKRIIVVDKEMSFRDEIERFNTEQDRYQLVAIFREVRTAYQSLLKSRPETIVIQVKDTPDNLLHYIAKIKSHYPSIKILIQCEIDDDALIFDLLTIGLSGLTSISTQWQQVVDFLNQIDDGQYPTSSMVTKKIFETFQLNKHNELSVRQNEILHLMIMGATHHSIADKLGISKETAKTHMKNLYKKLNVHSREAALAKAVNEKLILVI